MATSSVRLSDEWILVALRSSQRRSLGVTGEDDRTEKVGQRQRAGHPIEGLSTDGKIRNPHAHTENTQYQTEFQNVSPCLSVKCACQSPHQPVRITSQIMYNNGNHQQLEPYYSRTAVLQRTGKTATLLLWPRLGRSLSDVSRFKDGLVSRKGPSQRYFQIYTN